MKKWLVLLFVFWFLFVWLFPLSLLGSDSFKRVAVTIPMRDGKYLAGDLYTLDPNLKLPSNCKI